MLASALQDHCHETDPEFQATVAHAVRDLKAVLGHASGSVLLYAASGTGALEAAVQNLGSVGRPALVASNGYFGRRVARICEEMGLETSVVAHPDGAPLEMKRVEAAARDRRDLAFAACVHCESSTGIVNDLGAFAEAVRPAMTIVDVISSAGAMSIDMDGLGLDVAVGSAGKALMGPPGVSFISLSDRAVSRALQKERGAHYFSVRAALRDAVVAGLPAWTPPISLIREFAAGLRVVTGAGGLEAHAERYRRLGRIARRGLAALQLELLTPDRPENCVLTAARPPPGLPSSRVISELKTRWKIALAGGAGGEDLFRIGHVGHVDTIDVVGCILALADTLLHLGVKVDLGRVAEAAASAAVEDVPALGGHGDQDARIPAHEPSWG